MVNFNKLKQSKFLGKEDVDPPVNVTISSCIKKNVALESQAPEMKYTLEFQENLKPLVLNFTNASMMAQITGQDDTDDWVGAKVQLYNDPSIMFAGKLTGGIRIRAIQQGGLNQNQQQQYNNAGDEREQAKQFAEQYDLPVDGEGQQH